MSNANVSCFPNDMLVSSGQLPLDCGQLRAVGVHEHPDIAACSSNAFISKKLSGFVLKTCPTLHVIHPLRPACLRCHTDFQRVGTMPWSWSAQAFRHYNCVRARFARGLQKARLTDSLQKFADLAQRVENPQMLRRARVERVVRDLPQWYHELEDDIDQFGGHAPAAGESDRLGNCCAVAAMGDRYFVAAAVQTERDTAKLHHCAVAVEQFAVDAAGKLQSLAFHCNVFQQEVMHVNLQAAQAQDAALLIIVGTTHATYLCSCTLDQFGQSNPLQYVQIIDDATCITTQLSPSLQGELLCVFPDVVQARDVIGSEHRPFWCHEKELQMHAVTDAQPYVSACWTAHPRQCIVADATHVIRLDMRSKDVGSSLFDLSETLDPVRLLHSDFAQNERAFAVVGERTVRIFDCRLPGKSPLVTWDHMLFDLPRFAASFQANTNCVSDGALFSAFFVGGRSFTETHCFPALYITDDCDMCTTEAPYSMLSPVRTLDWFQSHLTGPGYGSQSARLRAMAPLRGLACLRLSATNQADRAVVFQLTDVDLYCEVAGVDDSDLALATGSDLFKPPRTKHWQALLDDEGARRWCAQDVTPDVSDVSLLVRTVASQANAADRTIGWRCAWCDGGSEVQDGVCTRCALREETATLLAKHDADVAELCGRQRVAVLLEESALDVLRADWDQGAQYVLDSWNLPPTEHYCETVQ